MSQAYEQGASGNPARGSDFAPAAESPCGPLATSLRNPAALQRIWQAALVALKKNKAAYGVLFLNTKAVYDESLCLFVIEFPLENSFAYKAVQKPDVQEAVSAALAQACGEAMPFAYAQAGSSARAATPSAVAPARAAQPQPAPAPQPASAPQSAAQPQPSSPPQPAPAPQPASAPQPAARPQPVRPAPAADDLPPYEDEAADEAEGLGPRPFAPPLARGSLGAPEASGFRDASARARDADAAFLPSDELATMLAAGFGDGVSVKEVKE